MAIAANPDTIRAAADLLRAGGLVAMPTETVYGLAADALNADAVAKIFAAKGRPADHPLIVHLPDAAQLPRWASSIPREALALARAFWPGPLTLILERDPGVPDAVTGGQDTVGVRVPNHPVALALLRAFDSGVAAPSANRFGRISPTTAAHVVEELGDVVAMVLDGGPCDVGIESTILDLSRSAPVILRPGAITAADIARVIGRMPGLSAAAPASDDRAAPRVSGSLAAHYAPRTPLRLEHRAGLAARALAACEQGLRIAVLAHHCADPGDARLVWRTGAGDAAGFAHALYAQLRSLDGLGFDLIVVESPPDGEAWRAVTDRLARAAAGSGVLAD